MIKKAVLPVLLTPFLMVFSINAIANYMSFRSMNNTFHNSPSAACTSVFSGRSPSLKYISDSFACSVEAFKNSGGGSRHIYSVQATPVTCPSNNPKVCVTQEAFDYISQNPRSIPKMTDEECQSENGDTFTTSNHDTYNYLQAGGSVKSHNGACTVSSPGGVSGCTGSGESLSCIIDIESSSTNEYGMYGEHITGGLDSSSDGTFSVIDFNTPDYLEPLPGNCSDPSSCVTIGDTSYLVDWDSAPDYFSYVDSNGTTYSKPSSGGGSGGDNGGGDPTDPTDPGGDNGGGGSDGGSTVPDFEFDESGIIEAIGTAGRSNRNAINALSNDVTGAISDQTNSLNNATTTQTNALNSTLNNQTHSLTSSLDDQTNDLTTAIDDQTGSLSGSLDALGTSIVDAINSLGADEGEGDGEGDQEGFFEGLVDSLADRFDNKIDGALNPNGMPGDSETAGMIDGEGVADDVMESLEQGADQSNTAIYDEFEGIFEGGGIIDGALEPLRDFVTSFLPSLPTGGCTPLTFGAGERSFTIDCEGFNLLKAALSWVLFFFTAYQLISIPMDARKSQ